MKKIISIQNAENTENFDKSLKKRDSSVPINRCADEDCKCDSSFLACIAEKCLLFELGAMMFRVPRNIGERG